MPPMGILSALKQISPNINISSRDNIIEIVIPKEDIISQLKNSIPEGIRDSVEVYVDNRGVVMKIRLF